MLYDPRIIQFESAFIAFKMRKLLAKSKFDMFVTDVFITRNLTFTKNTISAPLKFHDVN